MFYLPKSWQNMLLRVNAFCTKPLNNFKKNTWNRSYWTKSLVFFAESILSGRTQQVLWKPVHKAQADGGKPVWRTTKIPTGDRSPCRKLCQASKRNTTRPLGCGRQLAQHYPWRALCYCHPTGQQHQPHPQFWPTATRGRSATGASGAKAGSGTCA